MADFYQGHLTTFHRLTPFNKDKIESELNKFNRHRPIALVLPVTPAELETQALKNIIFHLKSVTYLNEIVIALGRTGEAKYFYQAKKLFSELPHRHVVIWASGPKMEELLKSLGKRGLYAGEDGKGRSAWISYGYILSREKSKVIALHDCDIINYPPELLARLVYPIACTNFDYVFCKGNYARVTDRLHGRVTRLFVTPLIKSLIRLFLFGYLSFLVYLNSFRYPLAGEFSMVIDLAQINRIPNDWGLEVETLAEVYRNYSLRRICQAEICETYEHKHQPLSADDPKTGLMKMAIDIAKSIFRNLAIEGIILSGSSLKTLLVNYQQTAKDEIKRYQDDAAFNSLKFDYHEESATVEAFTRALQIAGEDFLTNPLYSPLIPNWNRVHSAFPDFLIQLKKIVDQENC